MSCIKLISSVINTSVLLWWVFLLRIVKTKTIKIGFEERLLFYLEHSQKICVEAFDETLFLITFKFSLVDFSAIFRKSNLHRKV